MSKVVPIAAVIYLLATVASLVTEDISALCLGTAITSLIALGLGFAVFPKLSATFFVQLPVSEEVEDFPLTISGQDFHISPWRKILVCKLEVSRIRTLVLSVLASCTTIYVVMTGHYSASRLLEPIGLFRVELIVMAGWWLLWTCLRWLKECARLRNAHFAIALAIHQQWGTRSGHVGL